MKGALFVAVAALALTAVVARCPNGCSGHGNCGQYDKCTCWGNWQGNDCSLRTCAYDHAWGMDKFDPHYYAECSNKGICDRATGLCDCFDQYEGIGCSRSSCPNGCSGHGKCRYLNNVNWAAATYDGWDVEKIQVCVCDGGFYGPDCSQRYCPMGDDPMTVCNTNNVQIQRITLDFDYQQTYGHEDSSTALTVIENDEFILSWVDPHGEKWYTQRIANAFDATASPDDTASRIRSALEALPNKIIPVVEVSTTTNNDYEKVWDVTFSDPRNIGTQNLIGCHVQGCVSPGCQPMYNQPRIIDNWVADENDGIASGAAGTDVFIATDTVFTARLQGNDLVPDYNVTVEVFLNKTTSHPDDATAPEHGQRPNAHWYDAFVTLPTTADSEPDAGALVSGGEIPIQYDHINVGYGIWIGFANRLVAPGTYVFEISTPSCTVAEQQAANVNRENAQCSNRGECDATTGHCACHEGYYGDNCATQTILV